MSPSERPQHPRLGEPDYRTLQRRAGWELPIELVEQEAIVIPPLSRADFAARSEVRYRVRHWQQHTGDDGMVLVGPPVGLPDGTWLMPDLAYWSSERLPQELGKPGEPAPDLVVFVQRIGSPDSYERLRREACLRAGVRDVWLMQPARQQVRTSHLGVREGKEMVLSPALPGFHMSTFQALLTRPDGPARRETMLKHLREVLSEEPDLATAVLIGSVARDDEDNHSDIDLLIDFGPLTLDQRCKLGERIEAATSRRADIKTLGDAMRRDAFIIEDAIEDGISLIDRDGTWAAVLADPDRWRALAHEQQEQLAAQAKAAFDAFGADDEPGQLPGQADQQPGS